MIPPGLTADRLLIIIDFSWWLNLAFRVAGVEGMAPIVVGRFVELLRGEVAACLAIAVDSVGPTWRHDLTAGLPDVAAYKGKREPKPREFYALSNRLIELVRLHRVPILYAEGWEADDCFAAAIPLAQAMGLDVAILTADKDLGQLVGPGVWLWDGEKRLRGPAEIETEWGVRPDQLGDLLAIVGDSSDNVRGVEGLGKVSAAAILRAHGDLETALATPPDDGAALDVEVKAAEKARAAAKKAAKAGMPSNIVEAEAKLKELRVQVPETWKALPPEEQVIAKHLLVLQAHADDVRLARRLVALDAAAPIEWAPDELPVGGYDVPAIRRAYLSLGFHNLAADVRGFPKARWDDAAEAAEEPGGGARGDRGGGAVLRSPEPGALDAPGATGAARTGVAHLCGFSGCADAPAHVKARAIVAAIRTLAEAFVAMGAIRRLDMTELCREEHAQDALARGRELEHAA